MLTKWKPCLCPMQLAKVQISGISLHVGAIFFVRMRVLLILVMRLNNYCSPGQVSEPGLHCTEPFIVIFPFPWLKYGWKDAKLLTHPSLTCHYLGRVKQIWYLSPMPAAKVEASLRIRAVSPEPPLLAHTSSESRGTFRQKGRSLAPLNGWACAVKICHDGMLEDTNSLDASHLIRFCVYDLIACDISLDEVDGHRNW